MSAILVTGIDDHLAAELVRAMATGGFEVISGTPDELGSDPRRTCLRTVRDVRPLAVVDCTFSEPAGDAASSEAGGLAAAAAKVGAMSVYVSCADVYDGSQEEPYVESDEPAPATRHGTQKLAAEHAVAQANPRHAIVRTSPWLFGTRRPGFVDELVEEAQSADRLPVDSGTRSTPMYADHVVDALVRLVRRPAYGVFHVAGGGRCTKLQFARTLFRALDITCQPVPAREVATGDAHANVVLDTRRVDGLRIPDWRLGLAAYLSERANLAGATEARPRYQQSS